MKTLADAWGWYKATKQNLGRMQRLGRKHWDDPSLEGASIWLDDQFKRLEASAVIAETAASLKRIDDLAIVVLFSVFEAQVRAYLAIGIAHDAARLSNPILKQAADDAVRGVEEASFYRRVLDPLKKQGRVPPELIEKVDQVRNYRNWVAHGRRERAGELSNVTPRAAYERLKAFLAVLGIAAEPELTGSDPTASEPE